MRSAFILAQVSGNTHLMRYNSTEESDDILKYEKAKTNAEMLIQAQMLGEEFVYIWPETDISKVIFRSMLDRCQKISLDELVSRIQTP